MYSKCSTPPRVLFIDAFDSFSNNIISLLETQCSVEVVKVNITADLATLQRLAGGVQAVVIGPGPGLATEAKDTGNIDAVWSLCEHHNIPVLGICLGFQTLVLRYGGVNGRLASPRHGIRTRVTSCDGDIFAGLPQVVSVQYHSNYCSIGHPVEKRGIPVGPKDDVERWNPSAQCPDLIPLAWDFDRQAERDTCQDLAQQRESGRNPHAILMSVRHQTFPFYGVQFHPESVRSSEQARRVVMNWWAVASSFPPRSPPKSPNLEYAQLPRPFKTSVLEFDDLSLPVTDEGSCLLYEQIPADLGVLSVTRALEIKPEHGEEFVLLDSERCLRPELGVHSIIGLISPQTLRVRYIVDEKIVQLSRGSAVTECHLDDSPTAIFKFLKRFMNRRRLGREAGPPDSPFWGGLVGYVSYEAGLETLGLPPNSPNKDDTGAPDVCFAFVERSVVINHTKRTTFVQSTDTSDRKWLEATTRLLREAKNKERCQTASRDGADGGSAHQLARSLHQTQIQLPDRQTYEEKIRDCLRYIRNGDSYELCLTDQTKISVDGEGPDSVWARYLKLRNSNPAPFGAYLKLNDMTVLSSSPERFLSWTRPGPSYGGSKLGAAQEGITCQFRPIKGTVKKFRRDPSGTPHYVDRKTAERLLSSAKEEAENLMIADLIRHDLAGVIGSKNVRTKDLMRVEEYKTVYQLVTVIEGHIPASPPRKVRVGVQEQRSGAEQCHEHDAVQGIDVLAASLPPGSMTGAPKKRSCELLRELEGNRRRSLYSGVLGYLDVGGGGDFSVVIRTAYKHSSGHTTAAESREEWRIGAGGAITALSTLEGEWEEMNTKLSSVLPVFRPDQ